LLYPEITIFYNRYTPSGFFTNADTTKIIAYDCSQAKNIKIETLINALIAEKSAAGGDIIIVASGTLECKPQRGEIF